MAVHLEDIIEETGGRGRYQAILCTIIHCCKLPLVFGVMFMTIGAKEMAVHLEDIIEKTGGCGRYQAILCTIIHCCKLPLVFGVMFMTIGAKVPDWWCADDIGHLYHNGSISELSTNFTGYKSCNNNNGTSCQRFEFDTSTSSIVPQWALVCDESWVTATMLSLQMAGVFIGNMAGGHVADLIGRKPSFYTAIATTSAVMFIAIFSTSWLMFAVLRFFMGISIGFQLTVMYNIQCEFVLPRWRTWIVAVPSWHIGVIIFSMISWGLEDWKYIHAVGAAMGAASLFTIWFVPESFRWKVVHGRIEDAGNIVRFVAKVNKRSIPSEHVLEELATNLRKTESQKDRKYSILDLTKSKVLVKNSLLLAIVWMTLGLGTYGIRFGVQALAGSVYANLSIVAAISIPLQFALIYLQNRIGRKKTNMLFFAVFTLAAGIVGIVNQFEDTTFTQNASRACALIALVAIGTAWSPVQLHTIELYPTVIRNIGYGLQNTMARIGAIIGPQLVVLDATFPGTMYFVCAVLGLLTILVILPLPETRGVDLQDYLTEKTPQSHVENSKVVMVAREED